MGLVAPPVGLWCACGAPSLDSGGHLQARPRDSEQKISAGSIVRQHPKAARTPRRPAARCPPRSLRHSCPHSCPLMPPNTRARTPHRPRPHRQLATRPVSRRCRRRQLVRLASAPSKALEPVPSESLKIRVGPMGSIRPPSRRHLTYGDQAPTSPDSNPSAKRPSWKMYTAPTSRTSSPRPEE